MISDLIRPDRDKEYIATNEKGNIQAIYVPDLQYTTLGKLIIFRLLEDRDMKILITGSGKTTGTGKTTLAIHLAHYVNQVRNYLFETDTEWTSKEYSFMNAWEYLKQYRDANPGDPIISDELEYMADRRRAMSNKNTYFSQAWSVLRYRNVITIGTAPGLSDLDKRLPEGADIWINVIHKGRANVYYLTMHDFEQYTIIKRLKMGKFKESILWNPIDNSDDYQWLKDMKEDHGVPGLDKPDSEPDSYDESDINQFEKDLRNSHVKRTLLKLKELGFYDESERQFSRFSQSDLAEIAEVSQPQVSKIKREMEKEGAL